MMDYHIHTLGHMDREQTADTLRAFLEKAQTANLRELGFAEHEDYIDHIKPDLIRCVADEFPNLSVKIGIEVNYRPDRLTEIEAVTRYFPWDYVIGSVHQIGDWAFDHPAEIEGYIGWDIDELYRVYYHTLEQAVRSGFFQIVGHLDVIKVFGYRSQKDPVHLADRCLHAIKEMDVCVEVNTNGWYKPVSELYPEPKILKQCFNMDIPITLGSDAHHEDHVGRDFVYAKALIEAIGYNQLAGFHRGIRYLRPYR